MHIFFSLPTFPFLPRSEKIFRTEVPPLVFFKLISSQTTGTRRLNPIFMKNLVCQIVLFGFYSPCRQSPSIHFIRRQIQIHLHPYTLSLDSPQSLYLKCTGLLHLKFNFYQKIHHFSKDTNDLKLKRRQFYLSLIIQCTNTKYFYCIIQYKNSKAFMYGVFKSSSLPV